MSTTLTVPVGPATPRERERELPQPIPFSRVVGVELRKMFDTRAGFWLMASILILSILATAATVVFAPDDELTYESFASATGIPMSVILPIVAVLSVTSEWSQRSALTTFTLVPSRGRVLAAKGANTLAIGVASMLVAAAVGAVGNLVGTAIAGVDPTWDVSLGEFSRIILANVLGMFVGFMLGVLLRNSPAAVVGYFVFSLVLPTISSALASTQDWWAENAPWFDFNYAVMRLFEDAALTGEEWARIGVTTLIWLVVPLTIGIRALLRSEVK